MPYVTIPKDLTKVKSKVLFNLTKRQLVCFSAGLLVGVPLFFLTKKPLGNSTAALLMILTMLPAFLLALYEKNGLYLYAESGSGRSEDSCPTAGHFAPPAVLCDPLQFRRRAAVLRGHHRPICRSLPGEHRAVSAYDHQASRHKGGCENMIRPGACRG